MGIADGSITSPPILRCSAAESRADMMDAAEAWLRARGVWKMQLLVRAENADAKGFYERLGYGDTKTICFQKVIAGDPGPGDAR